MACVLFFSVLFLGLVGHSRAAYCVCKAGSDAQLQKSIDYACGNGADCSAITQNGACFQPNTVQDHCTYAVNSYYQKKASSGATCDFSGTASLVSSLPTQSSGNCLSSSSSGTGTGTGGTSTSPAATNPSTTPTTTTPNTGTGVVPGVGTGGTVTGTGTGPGISSPFGGLAPTGGISTAPDGSAAAGSQEKSSAVFILLGVTLVLFAPPAMGC